MTANQGSPGKITSFRIIIGLVAGFALGYFSQFEVSSHPTFIDWVITACDIIGTWFLSAIKLLVVPVVFVCVSLSIIRLEPGRSKRMFGLTLAIYICTTIAAVSLAIALSHMLGVGSWGDAHPHDTGFQLVYAPSWVETLKHLVPANFVSAFMAGNMLTIILIAAFIGLVTHQLQGAVRQSAEAMLTSMEALFIRGMMLIMTLAPYGVFCLTTHLAFEMGLSTLVTLLHYFIIAVLLLLTHVILVYGSLIMLALKTSPLKVFRAVKDALIFGFCVSSSSATIPLTMSLLEQRLKADSRAVSFVIPLGSTLNMDGTAIIQGIATVFIANLYGIPLHAHEYIIIVIMSTVASIGAAGIPSAGLFTLAMVFNQLGLPLDGISLLLGVDRLLDMLRTSVNISGDVTTCLLVEKYAKLPPAAQDA